MAQQRRRVRVQDQGARTTPLGPAPAPAPVEADPAPVATCDCPHLDRDDWHEVESDWSDIAFVKTATTAVLGVPVGFGGIRAELEKKAAAIGATVPEDAMFLLGSGRFRRPVLLEVEGAPAGAQGVERPGGIAFTRLVPAPWGQMPKAVAATSAIATERYGRKPDSLWVWYLTCRLCSEAREFETLIVAHYRAAP